MFLLVVSPELQKVIKTILQLLFFTSNTSVTKKRNHLNDISSKKMFRIPFVEMKGKI